MVKLVNTKYIYMSFLAVIILFGLVVLPTYAKFPSNYVTSNDAVGLNLSFDVGISNIEEYQEVDVLAGKTKTFNVEVTNSTSNVVYYGVWYRMNIPATKTSDITIARLDGTETTTSGSLDALETKTVSVIIKNNTDSDIKIDIGVNSSTTGTVDIEYLGGKRLIKGVASINMMLSLFSDYDDYTYFRSNDYREKIVNASFVDYIDTSNASVDADSNAIVWDISLAEDDSIVAWLEENEVTEDGTVYYDLYIGSNDLIYAESLISFFCEMSGITSISFDNLDTSLTTTMYDMFDYCSSLTTLDVSNFDTSQVIDMSYMFNYCNALTTLDVSNFDTSSVTTMESMFYNCNLLTSLDVSNFDTSKVTNMSSMFQVCTNLTYLNLSDFDTSQVIDMSYMFSGCRNLSTLDVSNFDTGNVTTMERMFYNCDDLTSLDLNDFVTSNVTNMSSMFMGCSSLTSLNVSNFNTSNVTNMYSMFDNCSSLTDLNVSNFNTNNVTNMSRMFYNCSSLTTTITIKNTSTTDYESMFYNAAIATGSDGNSIAQITVNYVGDDTTTDVNESTEALVEAMIATKSTNSNVVSKCFGDYCS